MYEGKQYCFLSNSGNIHASKGNHPAFFGTFRNGRSTEIYRALQQDLWTNGKTSGRYRRHRERRRHSRPIFGIRGPNTDRVQQCHKPIQIHRKSPAQSTVQSAETALQSAIQQHEQNQRQEKANVQQLIDTLQARTNTSHTVLEKVLNFLDMTLGASPQFQYGHNSSVVNAVGNNDTIGKQETKNKIANLIRTKDTRPFPYSPDPIGNARQEINLLQQTQVLTQAFYSLVRNTPINSSFSETQRQTVQQTTEQYLSEISGEILALETQIRSTQTAQEQLGLGLVQTENAIENAKSQVELAKANSGQQVQIARNQIVSANNMKNELQLKATFDGIITQKFAEEGSLIAPGNPIFQLADRSVLKIYTDLPDTHIGNVSEDMPVEISIDGLREVFSGKITRLDPAVNPSTRTLGIEITLDESPDQIRIGMFARAKIQLPKKEAFFVPKRFIKSDFNGTFIHTENGKKIEIQLGEERNGMSEIISPELTPELILTSN
ncbi:HlyD family efflux transporter periplasmic adaptor subunit [Candidatus Gracilibacteria bacterium]|nr:HlyD family efflux transporter periplasmic adaptor subunit [Candidatus Gracilibacteria bacterium]